MGNTTDFELYHLLLLPETTLKTIRLIKLAGFVYGEQSEFVDCNIFNDQTIIGEFCIEVNPGVVIQRMASGHWWFHPNDEFSLAVSKEILNTAKL
jgi:hypothetical protein